MFKDKYQNRRILVSILIVLLPQLLTFGFRLSKSYLTGLLISGVLLSILILVVWTDKKNRFWVTRYLDPNM